MITAAAPSSIIKGFHIVKGEYCAETVGVIHPNGDKGTYATFEIMGEQYNLDDYLSDYEASSGYLISVQTSFV